MDNTGAEADALNKARLSGPLDSVPQLNGKQAAAAISIPDHQLLRLIGCGSYGEVWLARHTMGMHRAVKVVYKASFKDERPFERELSGIRKFEPISRSHEGFVDILHVGIQSQQAYFYYVMELGDDQTSGQKIVPESYAPKTLATEITKRGRLSLQECLHFGLALSQALSELHQRELVHRDIKPSNVIFVNDVPKLADIGLVADIQEARSYVGTEGFIPPEGPGTPGADVYGLGKVLYEACTGKDRKEFPALPDWWGNSPQHSELVELNEILIQACEPNPLKRYQSAQELHADLLLLEDGKSIKRLRLLERRLASLKRIGGVLAVIALVCGLLGYELYREWRLGVETHERQVGADVAYGNRAMESGDLLGALPFFADALRLDDGDSPSERNDRLRLGSIAAQCPRMTQMWFLSKVLCRGQFSPDGSRVLVTEHFGRARIFDSQSGRPGAEAFGQTQGLSDASYSRDGRFIVTASEDGSACVWDATGLKQLCRMQSPNRIYSARFSPDGLRIVTSCRDGTARVWEVGEGKRTPVFPLVRHTLAVRFACFSHDGRLIVTTGEDGKAYLWDAANGQALGEALEHDNWVTYACFSPDDRRLITASDDHTARIWDVSTGRQILLDLSHDDGVKSVDFSPDGRLIVTADLGGAARLWDAETCQPSGLNPVLRTGERAIHACFSGDGHRLLITCADGSARLWDLAGTASPPVAVQGCYSRDGSRFLTYTNGAFQVWNALSSSPLSAAIEVGPLLGQPELSYDGRYVQTIRTTLSEAGVTNSLVQVWDVAAARAFEPGILLTNKLKGTALSQDGSRLLTFSGVKAQIWDVRTGTALAPLLHEDVISGAVFNPSGDRVATRSGYQARVWDANSGQSEFLPLKHPVPVSNVEFSPDGSHLVSCCTDPFFTKCFAQVWSATTGQPASSPLYHGDGVLQATFSPDGSRLVTASEDFTAILWEAATGRRLASPLRHRHQVQAVTFSPDGKWVATASWDKTARIWSAETGEPLTPPFRHRSALDNIQFLRDGLTVVTSDDSGRKWRSSLVIDERPVRDLILQAYLLSGASDTSAPRFRASRPESIQAIWRALQAKYPSSFSTSGDEIANWHAVQAEENERAGRWFAAAFHLNQLLWLRPGDSELATRLARAKEHRMPPQ